MREERLTVQAPADWTSQVVEDGEITTCKMSMTLYVTLLCR